MRRIIAVMGVAAVMAMAVPGHAAQASLAAKPKLAAPSGAKIMVEAHLSDQDILPIVREFLHTVFTVASKAVPAEMAAQIQLPTPDDLKSILAGLHRVDVFMLQVRKGASADLAKFYVPDLEKRGLYTLFRASDPGGQGSILILTAPQMTETFILATHPGDDGDEAAVISIDGKVDFSGILAWVREHASQLAQIGQMVASSHMGGMNPGMPGMGGEEATPAVEGPVIGFTYETNDQGQLVVMGVTDGSLAAKAGMQTGDVIVAVDGTKVADIEQASELIGAGKQAGKVELTCLRGGKEVKFSFTFDKN